MGKVGSALAWAAEKATSGDKTVDFFPTESRKKSFANGTGQPSAINDAIDDAIEAHDADVERKQKSGERRAKFIDSVDNNLAVGTSMAEKIDYKTRSALKENKGVY